MEPITAYDHLKVAGEEACNAIRDFHHLGYQDRINRLMDALHIVADAYIEYGNKIDAKPQEVKHAIHS